MELCQLHHPSIVATFGGAILGGEQPVIVHEHMHGGTIEGFLDLRLDLGFQVVANMVRLTGGGLLAQVAPRWKHAQQCGMPLSGPWTPPGPEA